MRKIGVAVVMGGMLLGTVGAHAAPVASQPGATPIRVNPGPLAAVRKVEVTVAASNNKCGEPAKARVTVVNKTLQPWAGVINFVAGGSTSTPVAVAAFGSDDATKTVDVVGPKLDCGKPLGSQGLRVWKNGETATPIFVKVLKPTKVSAFRDLSPNAPPSTETKVWLRRVVVDATCGGNVTATAMLHSFTSAPQEAKVKLGFGIYVKESTVEVRGSTPVPYGAPSPLDCNAAGGIPAFDYTLLTGLGATGKVDGYEVTFEPT